MRRNPFKKYRGFIRGEFLNFFAFRSEIIGWVAQDIITLFIMVFLWFSIYKENGNKPINGFTYPEMIAYLVTAVLSIQWINNGTTFQAVNNDIFEGQISSWLIRPISYRGKNLACTLGDCLGNFTLFFLPLATTALVIFTFGLGLPFPTFYNIPFYLFSGFLAILIIDSLDFLIAQLGFLTNSLFGIMIIKGAIYAFFSGSSIPYSFFPEWAQKIMPYLPFAGLSSTPVNILLGRFSLTATLISLALSSAWAAGLYGLSVFVNHRMTKHVISVGG
jgi:ABC-2 type transport system permease protein